MLVIACIECKFLDDGGVSSRVASSSYCRSKEGNRNFRTRELSFPDESSIGGKLFAWIIS